MKIYLRAMECPESYEVYSLFQKIPADENGFTNFAYGLSKKEFDEVVKKRIERGKVEPNEEVVPDTTYVFFADDVCVGFIKLRHCLNDRLRKIGGHIGYGIAPEYRGKGYAKRMLAEVLKEAKAKGIDRVMLSCDDDNPASYKTIEANKGKLEKVEDGVRNYWIDL
jgi:predicted acetyltransferase